MFLANIFHESGGLQYRRELNPIEASYYSGGIRYIGRGYIQLTHDYNYRAASEFLFNDHRLLQQPELVENEDLAWLTAAWFWNKNVHPRITDFDSTIRAINGMELSPTATPFQQQQAERRRDLYRTISMVLKGQEHGPAASASRSSGQAQNTGAGQQVHTVQSGEYLYVIGQKYGFPWEDIAKINNIPPPYMIHPGQKLVLGHPQAASLGQASHAPQTTSSSSTCTSASGTDQIHTVQQGEYLYVIGQKYGIPWEDIAKINNISPPYMIYPGQKLALRHATGQQAGSFGQASHTPSATNSSGAASSETGVIHTVQQGEYLYLIGQKYGVPWEKIAKDNKLPDPTLIHPGQKLRIIR